MRIRDTARAALLMAVSATIYMAECFWGSSSLITGMDHRVVLVRFATVAHHLRNGHLPLWEPLRYTGVSLVHQTSVTSLLHPLPWLMAVFGDMGGYMAATWLLVFSAGFLPYLYFRKSMGAGFWPSMLGGWLLLWSPSVINLSAIVFTLIPFIAAVFLLYDRCVESADARERRRLHILLGLTWAVMYYLDEPREIIFLVPFFVLYAGCRLYALSPPERPAVRRKAVAAFLGGGMWGILFSAAGLLPFVFKVWPVEARLGEGGFVTYASRDGFPLWAWLGVVFPFWDRVTIAGKQVEPLSSVAVQHGWLPTVVIYSTYAGILFLPAAWLAWRNRRVLDGRERFFLFFPLVYFVWMTALAYVPGFYYWFAYPLKAFGFRDSGPLFHFCAAGLIVWALERLCRQNLRRSLAGLPGMIRIARGLSILYLLSAAGLIGLTVVYAVEPAAIQQRLISAAAPFGERGKEAAAWIPDYLAHFFGWPNFALLLGTFFLRAWIPRRFAGLAGKQPAGSLTLCALAVCVGLERLAFVKVFTPFSRLVPPLFQTTPESRFLRALSPLDRVIVRTATWDEIIRQMDTENITDPVRRFQRRLRFPETLETGYTLDFTVPAFGVGSFLNPWHHLDQRIWRFIHFLHRQDPDWQKAGVNRRFQFRAVEDPLLDLAGATYVLSSLPLKSPDLRFVQKGQAYWIYQRNRAFPRAFLVGSAEIAETPEKALEKMSRLGPALRWRAILEEPFPAMDRLRGNPEGRIRWIHYGPTEVRLRVDNDRPALLVLTDTYDPDWHAEVDGSPARIWRTDYLFRGVYLEAGHHSVLFRYRPIFFMYSWLLTAAGCMAAVFVWVGSYFRGGP